MASTEKYLGTAQSAVTYVRCKKAAIDNTAGNIPSITFFEEKLTKVENQPVKTEELGSIIEYFTNDNINTQIPLVHPDTMQSLGKSMTYMEINIAIRSLYYYLATIRDSQP